MLPEKVSLEVLAGAEIFGSMTEADRQTLARCLTGRRYAPGEVVFREGQPGDTLLLVAEGTFIATMRRRDGTEAVLNRMRPVELAGEMAVLDPHPRSATVRAETDAVAYELSHDTIDVLRQRAPGAINAIVNAAIRDVTRRLRRLDEWIEDELTRRGPGGPGAPRP